MQIVRFRWEIWNYRRSELFDLDVALTLRSGLLIDVVDEL
jgi:hypothetical protein